MKISDDQCVCRAPLLVMFFIVFLIAFVIIALLKPASHSTQVRHIYIHSQDDKADFTEYKNLDEEFVAAVDNAQEVK